jgi:hypothetical protein
MKRVGFVLFAVTIALMLTGSALAQPPASPVGDESVYFVTYYANAHTTGAPDGTIRVINDGDEGAYSSGANEGNIYATFFVFNDSEELATCCSCKITPDGLLSESVNKLTTEVINGVTLTYPSGVIKVISSSNGFFPQAGIGNPEPSPEITSAGLHGWSTHIQSVQNKFPVGAAPWTQTETLFADANLTTGEQTLLELLCWAQLAQLSVAPCPCTQEDQDF